MANLSRQYCAYFGDATEVWKQHVIGEIIVAFDEYRDSVCKTLQDAANSASTGGGQDVNNQEMFGVVLENAQQQAEQRIANAVNQTLNQPPPVLHSPVVSILANQSAQVNPPADSAISQSGVISGQNDDNSLDVSIKSEVDSSSESECESDTDDDEIQVKEEPNEEEEDITGPSEEQTENANNNFDDNHETNDSQMGNSSNISLEFNSRSNPDNQINVNEGIARDNEVDVADDGDGNLEEDETADNMEIEENAPYDRQESDNEGSMIDEENGGEEVDHFEDQVNMNDGEENDEDYRVSDEVSTNDTTDDDDAEEEEQAAGPLTSTRRRSTRQVSMRQSVPDRQSKRQIKVKKAEPFRVVTKKLKCTVSGCKKVVKNKNALNYHLLSAHKLKKFRCLVRRCHGKVSTSFTTQAQFSDHVDLVHGRTTRLACKCSKKFKSYKVLCTHYRNYHELGHFACSNDGCTFKPTSTRIKVLHHLANHREAKYECPVDGCDRSFKKKNNLDKHRLTHSGQRPFPCTECDKSFTLKGNLTVHLRIHLNDKCYRCTWPQCTHSSTNRSNVITHIRVVHFELPKTKKQQAEEGIEDDRDPCDYLAKN